MGNKSGKGGSGSGSGPGHRLGGGGGGGGGGGLTASERAKVREMQSMGFDASPAVYALRQTGWDVQAAVDALVRHHNNSSSANAKSSSSKGGPRRAVMKGQGNTLGGGSGGGGGDRRAAAALAAERRANQKFGNASSRVRKTNAKGRAERAERNAALASADAAASASATSSVAVSSSFARAASTFSAAPSAAAAIPSSSSSSFPKGNNGKNPEERINVLANQVARFPDAVDTLIKVVGTILKNPGVEKFRQLKTQNKRFRATVGSSNGAGERFLAAMGFVPSGEWIVLNPSKEDAALLWLGKSALEKVQISSTYLQAKGNLDLKKALDASSASADEEEMKRRAAHAPNVVPEPEEGAGGTTRVLVVCGSATLKRRFCSDDTLENIASWLGATHSSLIPQKLLEGTWVMYNTTLHPEKAIEYAPSRESTLQGLDLWPSCELELRAATI